MRRPGAIQWGVVSENDTSCRRDLEIPVEFTYGVAIDFDSNKRLYIKDVRELHLIAITLQVFAPVAFCDVSPVRGA